MTCAWQGSLLVSSNCSDHYCRVGVMPTHEDRKCQVRTGVSKGLSWLIRDDFDTPHFLRTLPATFSCETKRMLCQTHIFNTTPSTSVLVSKTPLPLPLKPMTRPVHIVSYSSSDQPSVFNGSIVMGPPRGKPLRRETLCNTNSVE